MRLFVAIDIPREAAGYLESVQRMVKGELAAKRWQPWQNLHLTLHFLGEVSEASVPELVADMEQVGSLVAPFRLALGRFGAFPQPDRPHVLWLGVAEQGQALQRVHHLLGQRLSRHSWLMLDKRPYKPHITLARGPFRGTLPVPLTDWDARFLGTTPPSWSVQAIHLYRSQLLPQGAVHTLLHSAPLSGGAAASGEQKA